jgi:hypothetical protein
MKVKSIPTDYDANLALMDIDENSKFGLIDLRLHVLRPNIN